MLGQMLKVWNFSLSVFFCCILTFLIILIKPLTTKAYDKRASSGDSVDNGLDASVQYGIVLDFSHTVNHTFVKLGRLVIPAQRVAEGIL